MFFRKRAALTVVLVVALAMGALYRYITSGGLIARQKPPAVEAAVAHWVLHLSVPRQVKMLKNPLSPDPGGADVSAGRELYRQKCEICHAYDGSGKTDMGAGHYPPPRDLRTAEVMNATDGELFYFIRNGIRNTAMPGWQMPDQDIWRLVVFIRNLPKVVLLSTQVPASGSAASSMHAQYVGSAACRTCHSNIYDRWSKTRMANVVTDPKVHPEVILPDFSKPNPLVTFKKEDIAFVYGTKWKQRYFQKVGDDYFPLPAQWDVTNKVWRVYHVPDGAGITCFSCHDAHGTENNALLWKPANVLCLDCHGPNSPNGPHTPTIEQHTHHKAGSAGNECIDCHMPKIEQTIADVNVRSHTFRFITPAATEALKIPNPCNLCHADKSTGWAAAALKQWPDRSPWRMAQ